MPEWFLLPILSYINNTQIYSLYRKLGLQAKLNSIWLWLYLVFPQNKWQMVDTLMCILSDIFLSIIYIYVEPQKYITLFSEFSTQI